MWIFSTRGFVSVRPSHCPDRLLVRARKSEHISDVFPGSEIISTPEQDYLYQALIERAVVMDAFIYSIDAPPGHALDDPGYADCAESIYQLMHQIQPTGAIPMPPGSTAIN
jgi:hypothetical protein